MGSVSLEQHESSSGILWAGGRRKWTVDSGKALKNVHYRTQFVHSLSFDQGR